jgi:hypothetical protein
MMALMMIRKRKRERERERSDETGQERKKT